MPASHQSWERIFKTHFSKHDFSKSPATLTADMIKDATREFRNTGDREPRILCKQDTREDRPAVFVKNNLFLLPVKNGVYNIVHGEGYVDIPTIPGEPKDYKSKLTFELISSTVGDSEMQHLDYAYATSLVRTFMDDPTLVLTIRGRKYTPNFSFYVNTQKINVEGVQTEVDAGYEGEESIVLIEAKNRSSQNTIIRQLYYPFRQWTENTRKKVSTLFFGKQGNTYLIWEFTFSKPDDYNSIELVRKGKFEIVS